MSSSQRDPIVVERLIAASVEDVFAAWSDAESLGAWMCPAETISHASVETDFRVGGQFSIVMHGQEGDFRQTGEYLEIDPPKRLSFTWVSPWAPDAEQDTRVTVSLDPAGEGKTKLRLVHEAITTWYDNHEQGWAMILARLDERMSGGTPQ